MSLPVTWRQFQLFDFLPIRDPQYQSQHPLFSDPQLSAISAVQAHIVFAVNGHITLLDKESFEVVLSFCACESNYRVTFMRPLPSSNILVTLAEKQGSPALIKVWDLQRILKLDVNTLANDDTMAHKYVTLVSVHDGDDSYPISSFMFNDPLTCIALGYTNGKVILVRGDLLRDRGAKQRVVYEGTDPITSVLFNHTDEILYVTTTSKVFTLSTTGRNKGKPLRILSSDTGADLDCVDLEARTSKLLVGNTDGFNYYSPSGKAQVVGFNVAKRKVLRLFKNYLLVVCVVEESSAETARSTLTKLLVLDLLNMHISFSLTIPNSSVSHVFASYTDQEAYLLSTDGVIYKLREKAINSQIELVIQRELFPIALTLAKQHSLDTKTLLRINRMHAEFLYKNQDYDNSVLKYIDCLMSFVEISLPSDALDENLDDFIIDVITRFKEVSNIHNMTKFLAKLYELKLADCDHLTLLLCCYCKLKMKDQLDIFIAGFDLTEPKDGATERLDMSKLNYSLIINLFKECGYYSQVTLLLYKLNHPHMIVDIQLNDLKDYSVCLSFIKTLPVNELLGILVDFSQKLLDAMPLETTKLLIEVFTGKYKPEKSHSLFDVDSESNEPPETKPTSTSNFSYNTILGYLASTLTSENQSSTDNEDQTPTYLPPRPSLVYTCFINHSREFVVFLEACHDALEEYQGNAEEKEDLKSTLFEMYAALSTEHTDEDEVWADKARQFLADHLDSIDQSRALMIASMYDLPISDVFVKGKVEGSEQSAFETAQMTGDYKKALALVREFGENKPIFYKKMLKFVVSSNDIFAKASRKDIQYLVSHVAKHELATPFEIVSILSTNEGATIGLVKDYLIDYFSNVNKEIENNKKLIELYEKESTRDSLKLSELQTDPFILNNELCSSCKLGLEFPLIHFKCKHSYHQRCLNENTYIPDTANEAPETTCPLCAGSIREVNTVRKSQLRVKTEFDTFKMKLDESKDRFKVMIDYIGRGIMEYDSD